jgi:peptide/nickel transport system substrate-binding protein
VEAGQLLKETVMKLSRIVRWSGAAATAALLATSLGIAPASAATKDTVRYVGSNTPTSLNSAHRQHNLVENGVIAALVGDGFNYYNEKAQLLKKTGFGTYKQISKSPLRVRYTVKPNLVWSDGAPIDAYDVLLSWVISSGLYDDPATGTLWDSAGKRGGTDKITKFPTITDGGRTITFEYNEFVSNWEIQIGLGKPVHALTQLAYPNDTNQAAKVRFFKAVRAKDWTTLKKIADQWNTAYNILNTTGVTDSTNPKLLVSSGPYMVKSAVPGKSVSLVPNPRYTSGPKPKIPNFQLVVINDATAAAQALVNGEVDVMSPQPTKEAVDSLKANKNVKVIGYSAALYEHFDIVHNGPAWAGMSAAKAADLRRAILLTIPRQEIVDKLVKGVDSSARVLNSIVPYFTNNPNHAKIASANGVRDYTANETTRLAAAKALLAKHGYSTTNPFEIKMLYGTPTNERRTNQAALIVAAAAKVGIKITPNPLVAWGGELSTAKHDVQFFAWSQTSTFFTSLRNIYGWDPATDKARAQNYFNWKNLKVEAALTKHFADLTEAEKYNANLAFEKEYFADAVGLPIFQHPSVAATSAGLKGVKPGPFSPNLVWNIEEWSW